MQLTKQQLEEKLKQVEGKIQQTQDNARTALAFLEGQRQLLQEQLAELEKTEKAESKKGEEAEEAKEAKNAGSN